MIKNRKLWEQFEKEWVANQKPDYEKNLALYEAMYQEAVLLGVFPLKDPLEGIETDIKLARILNSVSKSVK